MALESSEKELVAIGASVGAGCRPCIEHHIPAAREAGLSEREIVAAVANAEAVRGVAAELLSARSRELLGDTGAPARRPDADTGSRADELAALGASIGVNSHPLLERHLQGGLASGLTAEQIQAAIRMAEYVQRHAAEMTADKASAVLEASNASPETPNGAPD